MAAPEEMKKFARYLYSKGFTVHVPRLKGHGTSPEDLARTGYDQWMESVEEAFVALRHSSGKRIIGGFSTGAGLALEIRAGRQYVEQYGPAGPAQRHGPGVCRKSSGKSPYQLPEKPCFRDSSAGKTHGSAGTETEGDRQAGAGGSVQKRSGGKS
jgi:hypothetical protein